MGGTDASGINGAQVGESGVFQSFAIAIENVSSTCLTRPPIIFEAMGSSNVELPRPCRSRAGGDVDSDRWAKILRAVRKTSLVVWWFTSLTGRSSSKGSCAFNALALEAAIPAASSTGGRYGRALFLFVKDREWCNRPTY